MKMKVAIVTNDGEYVSQHFGRSRYYKIYTIENNEIQNVEMRERGTGHLPRALKITPIMQLIMLIPREDMVTARKLRAAML